MDVHVAGYTILKEISDPLNKDYFWTLWKYPSMKQKTTEENHYFLFKTEEKNLSKSDVLNYMDTIIYRELFKHVVELLVVFKDLLF